MEIDFSRTDQSLGIKPPPIEKPHDPDKKHIDLIRAEDWEKRIKLDLVFAIKNREFDQVQRINFEVNAQFRKPFIPNKTGRYVLVGFFLLVMAFALIGYFNINF